jgi:hypothetical protein
MKKTMKTIRTPRKLALDKEALRRIVVGVDLCL